MAVIDSFSSLGSTHRGIHNNLATGRWTAFVQICEEAESLQAVSTSPGHTECIKNFKIANSTLAIQTFVNLGAYVNVLVSKLTTENLDYSTAVVTLERVAE